MYDVYIPGTWTGPACPPDPRPPRRFREVGGSLLKPRLATTRILCVCVYIYIYIYIYVYLFIDLFVYECFLSI